MKPIEHETNIALMEGYMIAATDAYLTARSGAVSCDPAKLFEDGFKRSWDIRGEEVEKLKVDIARQRDHEDAMCDLHYCNGLSEGFNCVTREEVEDLIEKRRGPALKLLKESRPEKVSAA